MDDDITLDEMVADLEEAAAIDKTELGEYWGWLTHLGAHSYRDFMTDEFKQSLEDEIRCEWIRLKEEFEVVVEEVSVVQKVARLKHNWE